VEPAHAEPAQDAPPPPWVLSTPTKRSEVWSLPLLAALLAVALVVVGAAIGDALGVVVGTVAGVAVAVGAVLLAVAGRRAYEDQTRAASWRLHVVRVLVGVAVCAVVGVGSLAVGFGPGGVSGALVSVVTVFQSARTVPRLDRLATAWASAAIAAACAVLVVLGLTVPGLPPHRAATWIGGSVALGVLAVVIAVVQFRVAARTPRD
jgi:hypothetical protein